MMKKRLYAVFIFVILALSTSSALANTEILKKLFQSATIAYNQADYKNAIKLYEKSIEIYPLAQTYNFLGLSHKAIGAKEEDIAWYFKNAIELDSHYAPAYRNLGKLYYSMGRYEEAKDTTIKAVELNPRDDSAQLSLGWIYLLGLSEPGFAIDHFKSVVENRSMPYANLGLGFAYIMNEEKFMALEMITTLRKMNHEDLAKRLEGMMREGRHVAVKIAGTPMILPEREASVLIKELPSIVPQNSRISQQDGRGMNVRLRKQSADPYRRTKNLQNSISGAERIRAMQQKARLGGNQYKGSQY